MSIRKILGESAALIALTTSGLIYMGLRAQNHYLTALELPVTFRENLTWYIIRGWDVCLEALSHPHDNLKWGVILSMLIAVGLGLHHLIEILIPEGRCQFDASKLKHPIKTMRESIRQHWGRYTCLMVFSLTAVISARYLMTVTKDQAIAYAHIVLAGKKRMILKLETGSEITGIFLCFTDADFVIRTIPENENVFVPRSSVKMARIVNLEPLTPPNPDKANK